VSSTPRGRHARSCRYTDLRQGLPGIATNLLADRLRELEQDEHIRREAARPPVATDLFSLTERGAALAPVLDTLGRWGGPLLGDQPESDAFRTRWIALPLKLHLGDRTPRRPPVTIEVRNGDEPILVETVADGTVRVRAGTAEHPDAILTDAPEVALRLLVGGLPLAQARARATLQGRRPNPGPVATRAASATAGALSPMSAGRFS
jgi:DNA-binding HxlR family transcriptional regulator